MSSINVDDVILNPDRSRVLMEQEDDCRHLVPRAESRGWVHSQAFNVEIMIENQNMIRWKTNFLPFLVITFIFFRTTAVGMLLMCIYTLREVSVSCILSVARCDKKKQKQLCVVVSLLMRLFLVKSWTQVLSGHLVCQNHFCLHHLWAKHARGVISILLSEFPILCVIICLVWY